MYYSHTNAAGPAVRRPERAALLSTETQTPTAMRQPALQFAITATASFQSLQAHSASLREVHLRQLFAADPARFSTMTVDAAGLLLDYSKNRVDATAMALLMDLACERGVEAQREAMFTGEKINLTEHRAVLHTARRAPRGTRLPSMARISMPTCKMYCSASSQTSMTNTPTRGNVGVSVCHGLPANLHEPDHRN